MKFIRKRTIRSIILLSLNILLLMSSIFVLTISTKALTRNLVIDNFKFVDDKINVEFPSDNFLENSIYIEDDITRTGSTIFVNDNWLALIENWYGTEIYNISDVNEPVLAKNYTAPDLDYDSTMIVQDNYLYIYTGQTIFVFNYTNPLSIVEETRYTGLTGLNNFAINGWYLYTISDHNFTIYNFENFSSLEKHDSYFNETYDYNDFNIKGNYSYVLTRYESFVILNITNKSNIQYSGEILINEDEYKTTIYIKNDNLFLFDFSRDLSIFNISDPLNITIISTLLLQNKLIIDIIVRDTTLFILDSDLLLIYDISNLEQIQLIGSYSAPDFSTTFSSFMIQNNYAYIHNTYEGHFVARNPIFIVNITNLDSPLHVFPHDKYDLWDWLEDLTDFMLALVIVGLTVSVLGVIAIPVVVFVVKKKKPKNVGQIDNQ